MNKLLKKIPYILIGLVIIVLLASPLFIKVKIECKNQSGNCPSEVNAKLQKLDGKNLFQAKGDASKILKSDFLVSNFSIQLKLPNILLVNLISKEAVFSILNNNSGQYFLVDASGTILSLSNSSNLPTLVTGENYNKAGQKVSDNDLFALKIIQGMDEMYQVTTGTIQNDTLTVDLTSGIRVLFPLEGSDPDILLGGVRLIYTKITTNYPGMYKEIDMRYKNPVLR